MPKKKKPKKICTKIWKKKKYISGKPIKEKKKPNILKTKTHEFSK